MQPVSSPGTLLKKLEVIAAVPEAVAKIQQYKSSASIDVQYLDSELVFDMIITAYSGEHYAKVESRTTIRISSWMEGGRNGCWSAPFKRTMRRLTDRTILNMEKIWDFANTVDIDDVREILDRQITYNTAIWQEGLQGDYGANIGKVLLASQGNDIASRAKAAAAAGSDARMNGCELPVIINSGSGNQGITVSIPVITYAKELNASQEQLYRALCLSNLTAIHQKTRIGRLSAYCGAVNAGAAAGCGIAYLLGGDYDAVIHTLVNALAIVSGMICDGAKSSCAAKIVLAVDAGLMGYNMYKQGSQFYAGDGIVGQGVEANIINIGRLGKDGMRETNNEIIRMMIGC